MSVSGLYLRSLAIVVSVALGGDPCEGLTLLSPMNSQVTCTIDLEGNVTNTWHGAANPASIAYYFKDQSILRPCKDSGGTFDPIIGGGRIQLINADDQVEWDFLFSDSTHQQHHDIEPLPNGNILLIAWERKTMAEAIEAGRQSINGEIWPVMIAEVEPFGSSGGNIVWEWHLWDHLIQEADPTLPGYGVVSDHPELLDINFGEVGGGPGDTGDWIHVNAIDYNPELDQIVFSSRNFNEFYIIDHSTSTAEAAGSTGGNSGMGGNILYRWGNPQVYGRGELSDQYFSVVHGANWIDEGLPGEGNILTFNNGDRPGTVNDYSTVVEIEPPLNASGTYDISSNEPFGPEEPSWTYGEAGDFYGGATQCGAYRMPGGNTVITLTEENYVFEVDSFGNKVWEYTGSLSNVARASRYSGTSGIFTDISIVSTISVHPNPASSLCTIECSLSDTGPVSITVFDLLGRLVQRIHEGILSEGQHSFEWSRVNSGSISVPSGLYLIRLEAEGEVASEMVTILL